MERINVICNACLGTGYIENDRGEECVCQKCDGWGHAVAMPDSKAPTTLNDEQHP
jgi:DnaJ-class molecular chaperone